MQPPDSFTPNRPLYHYDPPMPPLDANFDTKLASSFLHYYPYHDAENKSSIIVRVKICIIWWSELHFKKSNVLTSTHLRGSKWLSMGVFCAHLAKMYPLWTITDQSSTVQIEENVQNAIWIRVLYSAIHNNVMPHQSGLRKQKIIAWFDSGFKHNQFNTHKKCNEICLQ